MTLAPRLTDSRPTAPRPAGPRLAALALAAIGTLVFHLAGLPLPFLLGPMAGCLVGAFAGARMRDMGALGTFMRTFLGVAAGTAVTPAMVSHLPDFALSLAFVPVFVLLIGAAGYPLFRHVFGFDHATAWFGAMPGGLQDMLVFGEEAGGDIRALSLIHASRVLVIVTVAPLVMSMLWNVDLSLPPGASARDTDSVQIALMVGSCFLGWRIAARIGLFGATILGPMILTAILSLSGIITARPPAEIIWAAQFFIGIAVGAKYSGITLRELRVDVGAGVVYALILSVISLGFLEVIHLLRLAPALDAFLAFLPGGQSEMVVMAIIAGADLAYVVAHHLVRMVLVISLAPVAGRLAQRRRRPQADDDL